MTGWLTYLTKSEGETLADRLRLGRLKEVWGDQYLDQTIWPDGITLRAVDVTTHPDKVQAAVFVGDEAWHLLKAAERVAAKTSEQLDRDGWFPAS